MPPLTVSGFKFQVSGWRLRQLCNRSRTEAQRKNLFYYFYILCVSVPLCETGCVTSPKFNLKLETWNMKPLIPVAPGQVFFREHGRGNEAYEAFMAGAALRGGP